MAVLTEHLLFGLVKCFYRTEVAHSKSMKAALADTSVQFDYRAAQCEKVLAAAKKYRVEVGGRDVLDLGCNDGALTSQYLKASPRQLIGVDIDHAAVARARQRLSDTPIDFRDGNVDCIPADDASVDTILCYDVFEHVSRPEQILAECRRILRPGGKMLIGTWGWKHPFAPHLWATMPVPWAHVLFGERTVLRTSRRVFHADWYVPNVHDLDSEGNKLPDRYLEESISTDYLNKYLIRDFEKVFAESGLSSEVHLQPFGSKYARWTAPLLRVPVLREFFAGYLWAVLMKV